MLADIEGLESRIRLPARPAVDLALQVNVRADGRFPTNNKHLEFYYPTTKANMNWIKQQYVALLESGTSVWMLTTQGSKHCGDPGAYLWTVRNSIRQRTG